MILLLTTSYCFTASAIGKVFGQMSVPTFRLNIDRYWEYKFLFADDEFEIIDMHGAVLHSSDVSHVVMYKAQLPVDEAFAADAKVCEAKWVRSTLNYVTYCIARWAVQHSCLKLWTPYEMLYPKTFQMAVARKYFIVPEYKIHWGFAMEPKDVIVKSLVGRPLDNKGSFYAKIQNINSLSPKYPWFTQEIALGNRDATVLFINGNVHSYQFATERNGLTDWRTTQGTEANQWKSWNCGDEFECKVRAYMHDIGLKFGRLDFVIGGSAPQFLEVNPCGQFGWLDDSAMSLHKEVADAIVDPSSKIEFQRFSLK